MANFWNDICEHAKDLNEPIEAVEITSLIESYYSWWVDSTMDKRDMAVENVLNIPLSPDQAREYLNYEYDVGFGSRDCHNIYAWTKSYVLYVHGYDGSTSITYVKRNPS